MCPKFKRITAYEHNTSLEWVDIVSRHMIYAANNAVAVIMWAMTMPRFIKGWVATDVHGIAKLRGTLHWGIRAIV